MANRSIRKALKGHKLMSCTVIIYENGDIELVSYSTLVLRAQPIGKRVYQIFPHGQYWDPDMVYTRTTIRHIICFLREYFPEISYQEFKSVAEGCLKTRRDKPKMLVADLAKGVNLDYGW